MPRVTEIFRHPLKSHGREALAEVTLSPGPAMPWDRRLAVAHDISKASRQEWAACATFPPSAKPPPLTAAPATRTDADHLPTLYPPHRNAYTLSPAQ